MTLSALDADGLVVTGNLGLNALDIERHVGLLVATWRVTPLVVLLLCVPTAATAT